MKNVFRYILTLLMSMGVLQHVVAQQLPHHLTEDEKKLLPYTSPVSRGYTTPPVSEVRTPAEWEEIDGICVRWEGSWSRSVLRNIVKHAKEECTVYIVTENQNAVVNHLGQYGIDLSNIVFVDEPTNSIWLRDYGQWNVYTEDVDSLLWVDWIYNRPRPLDDVVPEALADLLEIPLYQTTQVPNDLVNTGGNVMVDGFGTAFSSELVLEENEAGSGFGISDHDEADVDRIMADFMGIERYIKMPTLPYDGIHHIDMHMKLLDEETLLVGEYPQGVADGPQIESNLDYVLNNFNSVFGTEYEVVRVPMPPENGNYPDTWGAYRTYTNSVFVNNTILVPTYEEQWDTTALRIYREELPGYKVVGIDCNEIIQASGAIHCITKAVASDDPLWISHQPLRDQMEDGNDHVIEARIQHRDGIALAQIHWTTDTAQGYSTAPLQLTDPTEHAWEGAIPSQPGGTEVFYYIHAEANNGKTQNRPMPAPEGYWNFNVFGNPTGLAERRLREVTVSPNPSNGLYALRLPADLTVDHAVFDMAGREIMSGRTDASSSRLDIRGRAEGVYLLRLTADEGVSETRMLQLIR